MVEVFKTNVQDPEQSQTLLRGLLARFPHCRIDFDLEDCDKVLRIEGEGLVPAQVIRLLAARGFVCEQLV